MLGKHGRDVLQHFVGNALSNSSANLPVKSRSVNSAPCAVLLEAAGALLGHAVHGIRTLAVLAAKGTDARLHDHASLLNAPLSLPTPVSHYFISAD